MLSNLSSHFHPSFFHSLQECEAQNCQTRPESVPIDISTFFEPEHRPVQGVHNVFKNFTKGYGVFLKKTFSQGQMD